MVGLKLKSTGKGKLSPPNVPKIFVGYPEGEFAGKDLTTAQLAFLNSKGTRPKEVSKELAVSVNAGEDYSLALQAYIRSKGDPRWHIIPRPFVEPAIELHREEVETELRSILQSALDNKKGEVQEKCNLLGLKAINWIRRFIQDYPANGLAPNAPSTIKEKGRDHPLIGKRGRLLRGVNYVVGGLNE